jgi:O-antigen/teichoic acid export membrane protein
MVALGLVSSVLVARSLGPAGRGEYAVAVAVSAIGVQVASLGLHTSSSWAASKRPDLVGALLVNGLTLSALLGAAVAGVLAVAAAILPAFLSLSSGVIGFVALSIPVGLAFLIVRCARFSLG